MSRHRDRQMLTVAYLIVVALEMGPFAVVLTTGTLRGDSVLARVGNSCCRRRENVDRVIQLGLIGDLNCSVWARRMD